MDSVISALVELKRETFKNKGNKELLDRIDDIEDFAIKIDKMLKKLFKIHKTNDIILV